MRTTRIHSPGPLAPNTEIALPAAGAYHAARVLRLRVGAPLTVFDGQGAEFHAEIAHVDGSDVRVRIGARMGSTPESPLHITLIQGISRNERMDWTLQKATELGVGVIAPVITARSVVRLDDKQAAKKLEHWRGIVVGACEQCGRSTLPDVREPVGLNDHLRTHPKEGLRLVLSPSAPGSLAGLASMSAKVALLIGPEGGLDDDEIQRARQVGFAPVRLGPRILRTETAAVTALSVLQAMWGDLA
jgi:16S rRNA (uracil1498-N3)-methyltransferase